MNELQIQRDPRNYIETYTGIKFYPLQPLAHEINIIDMVHAASGELRFGAHTEISWSLAQHSLSVWQLMRDWGHDTYMQFLALTHDFEESYLKDIPSPIKVKFLDYKAAGKFLQNMIWHEYFGIRKPTAEELIILKSADEEILHYEALALDINKTKWARFDCLITKYSFIERPRNEVKAELLAKLIELIHKLGLEVDPN
jgi:uncharacterized protein